MDPRGKISTKKCKSKLLKKKLIKFSSHLNGSSTFMIKISEIIKLKI